jgi:uncharacterized protein YecE (DUF72 family)
MGEYKAKGKLLLMQLPNIRCGPAGWSYAHWNGVVYPSPKPRTFHPLGYLAEYFDTIEINTSFYQTVRPEVTRLWIRQVSANPGFLFTAKLHRAFSHERLLIPAAVAAFKEGLWPLLDAGKLGCLLMQFPWAFRFTPENRDYLITLRRTFHEFRLVAELRHSSWMAEEAIGTLVDYRIGFCNIDQPQRTRTMPPTAFLTSGTGYIRLHGRTSKDWQNDFGESPCGLPDECFLYSEAELAEWKERIGQVRKHADQTFVITNNDGRGMSTVNALQLQTMLGGSTKAPPSLLSAYPEELAGFTANQPMQRSLFGSSGRRVA